jgi:glycosyltransferase involved in cell wall biosynthesis
MQLQAHAEVTVFQLDQYLLRSHHTRLQSLANRSIKDIASRLKGFDSVNIQLEYSTLGRTPSQIVKRLRWLIRAAPAVSVTFHTVLGHSSMDWSVLRRDSVIWRVQAICGSIRTFIRNYSIGNQIYAIMRAQQRIKFVHAIVHTKRDAELLHDVYHINNVVHHPPACISAQQAAEVRSTVSRQDFPFLNTLPLTAKLVGCFGFLSADKGFETAIRAIRHLPKDYHLLIFGGLHPEAINPQQKLDPYIKILLDEINVGHTIFDNVHVKNKTFALKPNTASKHILTRCPNNLDQRVHFLGLLDIAHTMRAMTLCNAVVLPDLNVDQPSFSLIAMAVGLRCRVLASRTVAFRQFARYYPNGIEFFEVGEYTELANLIRAESACSVDHNPHTYTVESYVNIYLQTISQYSPSLTPEIGI